MQQQVILFRLAAASGALSVILGAFGAHGLKNRLSPEMLDIFEVGVRYQMYHSLALLALAAGTVNLWHSGWTIAAGWAWCIGILIFSGSLYALVLSGQKWLGAITPVGGLAFIVGWVCLMVAAGSLRS